MAVRVPKAYFDTSAESRTATASLALGFEVQTPPCLTQNVQPHARAGISGGSPSHSSSKAMLPQWHLPVMSMWISAQGEHGAFFRRFARESSGLSEYGAHFGGAGAAGTRPSARPYNSAVDPLEYSRYARQLVAARPELREELERAKDSGWTREAMQTFLHQQGAGDEAALHSALRRLRQRVLLRTMARDLSGHAGLDEV